MPTYNEKSYSTIVVPDSSGVLDDENYHLLSPRNFTLHTVRHECVALLNDFQETAHDKNTKFNGYFRNLEVFFGEAFCEIDGKNLNLVDTELINEYDNHYNDIINYFNSTINNIDKINKKLESVENALSKMHNRYLAKKIEVDAAFKQYKSFKKTRPDKDSFFYDAWSEEYSYLKEIYNKLNDSLNNDVKKTANSINVTWYCEKRCK